MDAGAVRAWFDRYLDVFATLGRGDSGDVRALLHHYSVPLLVTTDEGVRTLTTADDVIAFARQQVDGVRAADYHHTDMVDPHVTSLNTTSVLFSARFVRRRASGAEIARLRVTYLIVDGPA